MPGVQVSTMWTSTRSTHRFAGGRVPTPRPRGSGGCRGRLLERGSSAGGKPVQEEQMGRPSAGLRRLWLPELRLRPARLRPGPHDDQLARAGTAVPAGIHARSAATRRPAAEVRRQADCAGPGRHGGHSRLPAMDLAAPPHAVPARAELQRLRDAGGSPARPANRHPPHGRPDPPLHGPDSARNSRSRSLNYVRSCSCGGRQRHINVGEFWHQNCKINALIGVI
jgi:hypothetical protein